MTEKINLSDYVKKVTLENYIKKPDSHEEKESLEEWMTKRYDEYEKNQISKMENEYIKFKSEWTNHIANATTHFVTSQEIFGMLNRTKEYEKYFLSLKNIAQDLDNKRRFSFSKKLNEIINDVQEYVKVCSQVYKDSLDNEIKLGNIQRDADHNVADIIRQANNYAQRSNTILTDTFVAQLTNSCICGEHLGDLYYRLEICPACGRYLHKKSF